MSDTITLSIGTTVEADVLTPSPLAYVERRGYTFTRWQGQAVIDGAPVTVQGLSFGDLAPNKWRTCQARPVPTLPERAVSRDPDSGDWMRSYGCPLPIEAREHVVVCVGRAS